MAVYQVEGTSTINWTLLVEGNDDQEASAAAICVAGWLSDLRGARAVRDAHHQVHLSRRLVATPAQDRVRRRR